MAIRHRSLEYTDKITPVGRSHRIVLLEQRWEDGEDDPSQNYPGSGNYEGE